MHARGFDAVVFESYRSPERAAWLYGFGRKYDDGRGVVTNAADNTHTWHAYYLAADIISASKEWDAPEAFWEALGECAKAEGLVWGGDWHMQDKPHVQHGPPMRVSPSPRAAQIVAHYGCPALWQEVGAL